MAYQAAARLEEHEDSKNPVRKNDLGEQKWVRKVSFTVPFLNIFPGIPLVFTAFHDVHILVSFQPFGRDIIIQLTLLK